MVKNLPVTTGDTEDMGWISGLGRSPGEGQGNSLQYSCLENPHEQRSLAGYIVHGVEESDMTEANEHAHMHSYKREGAYKGKNFKITVT